MESQLHFGIYHDDSLCYDVLLNDIVAFIKHNPIAKLLFVLVAFIQYISHDFDLKTMVLDSTNSAIFLYPFWQRSLNADVATACIV